jgi:hypothetical protein
MVKSGLSASSNSACWSRNLRHNNYSDSDSDSDTKPLTRQPGLASVGDLPKLRQPISEDAKLLMDFDLSSRRDEAVFRANPWSIAKVNAAARPLPSTSRAPAVPTASSKKHVQRNQLAEAFKKQAQRLDSDISKDTLKPRARVAYDPPPASVLHNLSMGQAKNCTKTSSASEILHSIPQSLATRSRCSSPVIMHAHSPIFPSKFTGKPEQRLGKISAPALLSSMHAARPTSSIVAHTQHSNFFAEPDESLPVTRLPTPYSPSFVSCIRPEFSAFPAQGTVSMLGNLDICAVFLLFTG